MVPSDIPTYHQKIPATWLDTLKKNMKNKEDSLIPTKLG